MSRSGLVKAFVDGSDVALGIEDREMRIRARAEQLQTLAMVGTVVSLVVAYQVVRASDRIGQLVDGFRTRSDRS